YNSKNVGNFHYIVAQVPASKRDRLVEHFHKNKVFVRKYFFPGCHRLEPYCNDEKYTQCNLPITEKVSAEIIVFPNGNQIKPDDITFFVKLIERCWLNKK
ncbi:MAG: DegT/DnrJ/EryC1/StrS family aminotransferase, partial [Burkholderiaceae bacterium]